MQQDEFFDHVKRMMILMMIADGTIDDEELATVRRLHGELSGQDLTDQEIAEEAMLAGRAAVDAAGYARKIAHYLSPEGKLVIVRSVFLVATAAGGLEEAQQQQLKRLPGALQMEEDAFRNVIAEASQKGDR